MYMVANVHFIPALNNIRRTCEEFGFFNNYTKLAVFAIKAYVRRGGSRIVIGGVPTFRWGRQHTIVFKMFPNFLKTV